jgi:hypothetical protein
MRSTMLALALAAGAAMAFAQAPTSAAPITGAASVDQAIGNGSIQEVQLRIYSYRGRRYCFYLDGWHGPGWYRCGWAWRRGYGWGGVYGWNDWYYGPAVRQFGRHRYEQRRYDYRGRVPTHGAGGATMAPRGGPAGVRGRNPAASGGFVPRDR